MGDSDDSSGSSGSESDSEENTLAPPKLAPSNQQSPLFNNLLQTLNNSKASSGKTSAVEISLKEEASIEYSSGTSDDSDEDEGESSQQEPEAEEEPLKKPK